MTAANCGLWERLVGTVWSTSFEVGPSWLGRYHHVTSCSCSFVTQTWEGTPSAAGRMFSCLAPMNNPMKDVDVTNKICGWSLLEVQRSKSTLEVQRQYIKWIVWLGNLKGTSFTLPRKSLVQDTLVKVWCAEIPSSRISTFSRVQGLNNFKAKKRATSTAWGVRLIVQEKSWYTWCKMIQWCKMYLGVSNVVFHHPSSPKTI